MQSCYLYRARTEPYEDWAIRGLGYMRTGLYEDWAIWGLGYMRTGLWGLGYDDWAIWGLCATPTSLMILPILIILITLIAGGTEAVANEEIDLIVKLFCTGFYTVLLQFKWLLRPILTQNLRRSKGSGFNSSISRKKFNSLGEPCAPVGHQPFFEKIMI